MGVQQSMGVLSPLAGSSVSERALLLGVCWALLATSRDMVSLFMSLAMAC